MSIVRLPLASPSFAALPSRPELRAQSVAFALLDGPRISFAGKADPLRLQRAVVSTRKLGARRCGGAVCHAVPVNAETLQWVSAVSAATLMLVKGTAIHKSFLVPLFALQAPASVVSWIKGEYGTWTAFLALLVRLFYFFPGELDLPFFAMLLVIVAPSQTMNIRGTQAGGILSLAIAAFLAFQHFSGIGNLKRAFDQGSIVATIAIISITVVTFLLLL